MTMSLRYQKPEMLKEQQLKKLLKALLETDESETPLPKYPNHSGAIEPWKRAMASGTLTGKVFSHHTVKNYARYANEYLNKHTLLSIEGFRAELEMMPPEMFGRKDKYFKAILCFAKFLIREKSLSRAFLDHAMEIQPKRHIPAKQMSITEEQLQALLGACQTRLEKLIIHLLSSTGLRASEFCMLTVGDLHLSEGYLIVQRGKGGKRRRVGLNNQCLSLLQEHLDALKDRRPAAPLFLAINGKQMIRDGLLNRIRRLGKRAGIEVSPHALRRAFVTINANKGRSLVMLQMACGHSDIKTTRSYCKTSEDEMIQAMKEW